MHRAITGMPLLAFPLIAVLSAPAMAREYYVGGPVRTHDMEIVANYLIGVEMAPTMADMPTGSDVIHIEADVHATADNAFGYPDGAWIGYIGIGYTIEKLGTTWNAAGQLHPMQAKDGPHYASNLKMDGAGRYKVTYTFSPPDPNSFWRHADQETGVPEWWKPFAESFTFDYPQK